MSRKVKPESEHKSGIQFDQCTICTHARNHHVNDDCQAESPCACKVFSSVPVDSAFAYGMAPEQLGVVYTEQAKTAIDSFDVRTHEAHIYCPFCHGVLIVETVHKFKALKG